MEERCRNDFFFQAEDGIRDKLVNGVQTCALPICRSWARGYVRQLGLFLPAGVLFGLSYAALFEAYYRGRVSVVAPLVATESLWGVLFSVLLLQIGRASCREGVWVSVCAVVGAQQR